MATCARCGSFLCHPCRARIDPDQCEPCSALTGDPLRVRSTPFSIGASLSGGWRMFWGALPVITVMSLTFGLPAAVLGAVVPDDQGVLTFLGMIFNALIGLIGIIGVLWAMSGVAEGRRVSVKEAFSRGLSEWAQVFINRIRAGLTIAVYTLLLVVPGVFKALGLLLVTPIAVVHRPSDPLEVSSQLTQSVKGELFLLCLLVGGILFVALIPFVIVSGLLGALNLEGGAEALTFVLELLTRPTSYFLEAVTLAAYYGLLRTRQQAEA